MSVGKSGGEEKLADGLRDAASCALRGLLAGNEQQILAAENALRDTEGTLREGLRCLEDPQAEQEAPTGLERARLAQTLASVLRSKGEQELPEETRRKLWTVVAELRSVGPQ